MWILRNGKHIRVDIDIDPSWNENDIWQARNLYSRFKSMGYSNSDCAVYASVIVWKKKWNGTTYSKEIETALLNISANSLI